MRTGGGKAARNLCPCGHGLSRVFSEKIVRGHVPASQINNLLHGFAARDARPLSETPHRGRIDTDLFRKCRVTYPLSGKVAVQIHRVPHCFKLGAVFHNGKLFAR